MADSFHTQYDVDPAAGGLDNAWLANITAQPGVVGREDLYIFGCGSDYRGCLAEFTAVAGPMALPPVSVRADITGHARINMYVNISHAWFKMAD